MDTQALLQMVTVGAILAIIPAFGIAALLVIRRRPAGASYWQQFADSYGYQPVAQHQSGISQLIRSPEIMELLPILPVLRNPRVSVLRPHAFEGTQKGQSVMVAEYQCTWRYNWTNQPVRLVQAPPFIFGAQAESASILPGIVVRPLGSQALGRLIRPCLRAGWWSDSGRAARFGRPILRRWHHSWPA